MFTSNMVGTATRVTGTATTCITSGNVIGVLCCSSATATGGVAIFHGVTASSSVCGLVVFPSGSGATYIPVPAYCSGGITIKVGAAQNPDITLFWNPVGGGTT
jgi:hypothetical protein